jgi:hypothetical protein
MRHKREECFVLSENRPSNVQIGEKTAKKAHLLLPQDKVILAFEYLLVIFACLYFSKKLIYSKDQN